MADQLALEHVLRSSALFKGLTTQQYADLVKQARPVSYDAGQMIFARGDKGNDIVIVLSGRIRISVLSLEGRELSFTHAGAGDIFGEIAAFDGGIRTADATAITAATAATIAHNALTKLLMLSPTFAQNAIASLCQKFRMANVQLENVALHAIEVRLARYLLNVLRLQCPEQMGKDTQTMKLDMSQSELALLIGASRPKVNSAISLLEGEGAISRRGDTFSCVVPKLRQIAAMD